MADQPSSLAGVWDRFMTPGRKVQTTIDPETGEEVETVYDFSAENFAQAVRNFQRTFSERRLVLDDGNHRAADPGHVRPQELARYSGEAAIWGGRVIAFWDQFPDLVEPDPAALLAALQAKFPRATSPDGVWGYRREVTELGERLLPNMHQTSPQFSMKDTDEEGNLIGLNISAISPVYVAHQNGTVLMNKQGAMAQAASGLHAPRPLGDENMAEVKDKEAPPSDAFVKAMRKAMCSKFGLDDKASDDEIMAAAFGGGPPAAAVEDKDKVIDKDKDAMGKIAAMSDLEEKPGNQDDVAANTSQNFAKMAKANEAMMAQLAKRTELAEKKAAEALAKQEATEKKAARATFSKWAIEDSGRWTGDEDSLMGFLDDMGGDITKATKHIEQHLPPRAAFARHTQGGHPAGVTTLKSSASDKATTFSKRTTEIYKEIQGGYTNKNEAFRVAQQKAKAESPDTYETWGQR